MIVTNGLPFETRLLRQMQILSAYKKLRKSTLISDISKTFALTGSIVLIFYPLWELLEGFS